VVFFRSQSFDDFVMVTVNEIIQNRDHAGYEIKIPNNGKRDRNEGESIIKVHFIEKGNVAELGVIPSD